MRDDAMNLSAGYPTRQSTPLPIGVRESARAERAPSPRVVASSTLLTYRSYGMPILQRLTTSRVDRGRRLSRDCWWIIYLSSGKHRSIITRPSLPMHCTPVTRLFENVHGLLDLIQKKTAKNFSGLFLFRCLWVVTEVRGEYNKLPEFSKRRA